MTTKRTAGPWLREIGTCEVWYVQTQSGTPIAIVERGELDGEEHLANTKLLAAAPDMAEALRANWEHTDDAGRKFYCNCPAYGTLTDDCRGDRDERHSTACNMARAALEKAGAA
jgi:hypothetical protein